MALITVQDFIGFRDVSKKVDADRVEECIDLAESSDLYDILGDFYFDVVKNFEAPNYSDLMDGSEFNYQGYDFTHLGLKNVLADFVYSRFVYTSNFQLTAFGSHVKTSQNSQPVDSRLLDKISKQAQIDGGNKFKIVQKYIYSEPVLFSRYCKNDNVNTGFRSVKISRL